MADPRIPQEPIRSALDGIDDLEFIDRGGQGDACRIRRGGGGDEVLKVIIGADSARVAREIATMQAVSNPHVMRFFEAGLLHHQGGDYPFIVGEYIAGDSVARRLEAGSWPSRREALQTMIGVLDGLAAIHGAEIVHRDIKPGNVALRQDDWTNPVILDLGLVRDLVGDSITVYPNLLGTIPSRTGARRGTGLAECPGRLWPRTNSGGSATSGGSTRSLLRRCLLPGSPLGTSGIAPPLRNESVCASTRCGARRTRSAGLTLRNRITDRSRAVSARVRATYPPAASRSPVRDAPTPSRGAPELRTPAPALPPRLRAEPRRPRGRARCAAYRHTSLVCALGVETATGHRSQRSRADAPRRPARRRSPPARPPTPQRTLCRQPDVGTPCSEERQPLQPHNGPHRRHARPR
jgi:serine/threonine protein kinase